MPQRLSLSMIVRNEEIHLARALETARLYADEIVVVDTGSTDGTKDIAKKFADRVYDFAWVDDFARARNYALQQCTGDFVMYLDADDVVTPESARALRSLFEKPISWDVLRLPYLLQTNRRGGLTMSMRVWRNFAGIRWAYPIHEVLELPKGARTESLNDGIEVVHWPLQVEQRRPEKKDRNLRIMLRALETPEYKDSAHLWFHLAKEYRRGDVNDQEKAIDALRRALELQPGRGLFIRSRLYFAMADCFHTLGRDDEALGALGQSIGEYPLWREPFWLMSEILKSRKQPAGALALLQMASQIPKHRNHLNRAELYTPEWHRILSQCMELTGDLGAALEEVREGLRRAPDDAGLLEREAELAALNDATEHPPRLLAVDVEPRETRAGETIDARFTVHTRLAMTLGLGMSLRHADTGATYSDPAHDALLPFSPGESEQTRLFTVPADAPPGRYDVDATVRLDRGGRFGKALDKLQLTRRLVVR